MMELDEDIFQSLSVIGGTCMDGWATVIALYHTTGIAFLIFVMPVF